MLQVPQIWPGAPASRPVFSAYAPSFFERLLTFRHSVMFPVHLVLPLLQLWNQPVLQRSLVSFSGRWYLETSSWALGVLIVIAHCYHCSPCSQYRHPLCLCLATIPRSVQTPFSAHLGSKILPELPQHPCSSPTVSTPHAH